MMHDLKICARSPLLPFTTVSGDPVNSSRYRIKDHLGIPVIHVKNKHTGTHTCCMHFLHTHAHTDTHAVTDKVCFILPLAVSVPLFLKRFCFLYFLFYFDLKHPYSTQRFVCVCVCLLSGIAPNITAGPSDSTVIDRMSIILHCETAGAPRPAITWQKGLSL